MMACFLTTSTQVVWFFIAAGAEVFSTCSAPHSMLGHVLSSLPRYNLTFFVLGTVIDFCLFKRNDCLTAWTYDHVRVKINHQLHLLILYCLKFFSSNMLLLLHFRDHNVTSQASYFSKRNFILKFFGTQQLSFGIVLEARHVKLMEASFTHEHVNLTTLRLFICKRLPAVSACQTILFILIVIF